jgi:hypothetical protein
MSCYRVTFFKNLLSSDGHPFKCIQRAIDIRHARNAEGGGSQADRHTKRPRTPMRCRQARACCASAACSLDRGMPRPTSNTRWPEPMPARSSIRSVMGPMARAVAPRCHPWAAIADPYLPPARPVRLIVPLAPRRRDRHRRAPMSYFQPSMIARLVDLIVVVVAPTISSRRTVVRRRSVVSPWTIVGRRSVGSRGRNVEPWTWCAAKAVA